MIENLILLSSGPGDTGREGMNPRANARKVGKRALDCICSIIFPSFIGVLAVTTNVEADSVTHTVHGDFNAGNAFYENTTSSNNDLRIQDFINTTDGWYRGHYDGSNWQVDLDKDIKESPWTSDICLGIDANPWSDASRFTVAASGHIYRTGTANEGTSELGIGEGNVLDMPGTYIGASQIRFLTHGARNGDTSYVITIDRFTGGDLVVTVPILDAATSARGNSGTSGGVSWSTNGIPNFTATGTSSCVGNGGDEVVLNLPPLTRIVDITIDYDTNTANPWLGGPIAMSVVTNQTVIESNYTWRGTYRSSSQKSTAVGAPSGTRLWYEVDWTDSSMGAASEVELFVRCGTDTNNNGTISNNEWKDEDGGTPDAWQGPIPMSGTSPVTFNNCTGSHLQYRMEFFPEFSISPRIQDITFTFNPDNDSDGYYAEHGNGPVDCNDNDASFNHDNNDGDGHSTCQGDCNDNDNDVYPGRNILSTHINDAEDQDCNGFDECYLDNDQDGQGTNIIIDDFNNLGCYTNEGESDNNTDCVDTDPDIFLGDAFGSCIGDNDLCFPISTSNSRVGLICL